MSEAAPDGISIEVDVLRRLLAAAHVSRSTDWRLAQAKAEQDLQPLCRHLPAARHHGVDVLPEVLARILDAVADALERLRTHDAPWTEQVAADTARLRPLCRIPQQTYGARSGQALGHDRPGRQNGTR